MLDDVRQSLRIGHGDMTARDALLTRLTQPEWLVTHGDLPQSWALRGVDARPGRFVHHVERVNTLQRGRLDVTRAGMARAAAVAVDPQRRRMRVGAIRVRSSGFGHQVRLSWRGIAVQDRRERAAAVASHMPCRRGRS
jgi:hypothetical protein